MCPALELPTVDIPTNTTLAEMTEAFEVKNLPPEKTRCCELMQAEVVGDTRG